MRCDFWAGEMRLWKAMLVVAFGTTAVVRATSIQSCDVASAVCRPQEPAAYINGSEWNGADTATLKSLEMTDGY